MADFHASIVIHKPVEDVFSFMTNLENASNIMPNVTKAEQLTEGPMSKGSKYVEIRNLRGRIVKAEIQFTDFEPNKTYTTRSSVNGVSITYEYQFVPVEEGTQVQFQANVKVKGIFSFITKSVLIKNLIKEDGDHLTNVKKMLEIDSI